jgi:hypothetical protein
LPLVNLVRDRPLGWGEVVWPQSPRFVQPEPALRVVWPDRTELCWRLARQFRESEIDGNRVIAALAEPLAAITDGWAKESTDGAKEAAR